MKKSHSSQNTELTFSIEQDAISQNTHVGETNEIGPAQYLTAPSKPATVEPAFRLLQKRLRRERRYA